MRLINIHTYVSVLSGCDYDDTVLSLVVMMTHYMSKTCASCVTEQPKSKCCYIR